MTLPTLPARCAAPAERVLFKSLIALAVLWPVALLVAPTSVGVDRFFDGSTYYAAGRAYLDGTNPYLDVNFRQWPAVAAHCAPTALLRPIGAARLPGASAPPLRQSVGAVVGRRLLRVR
jgi:hypothetical protein